MAKTTGMRMAKASMAEADMAVRLANMLGELEKGHFPWVNDGTSDPDDDPLFFDENDPEHLKLFYERVTALLEPHPGGLFRVAFGYATILGNDVLDPEDHCLALNPKYGLAAEQRDGVLAKVKSAMQCHPNAVQFLLAEAVEIVEGETS